MTTTTTALRKRVHHSKVLIAYHEAGHAIVAEALSIHVEFIGVNPRVRSGDCEAGLCTYESDVQRWFQPGWQADRDCHTLASTYSVQRILAERQWRTPSLCGTFYHEAGYALSDYRASDYAEVVIRLMGREGVDKVADLSAEALAYLHAQEARAEQLVTERWPAVVAVAEALVDRLRSGNAWLVGRDVRRLIADAMGEPVVVTAIDTLLAPTVVEP